MLWCIQRSGLCNPRSNPTACSWLLTAALSAYRYIVYVQKLVCPTQYGKRLAVMLVHVTPLHMMPLRTMRC